MERLKTFGPMLALLLLAATACQTSGIQEEQAGFSQDEARIFFESEIREVCEGAEPEKVDEAVNTLTRSRVTVGNGYWSFLVQGRSARVYAGGRVSGELLEFIGLLCDPG